MFESNGNKEREKIITSLYNNGVCGKGTVDCADYDGNAIQSISGGLGYCNKTWDCKWKFKGFIPYVIYKGYLFGFCADIACSGIKKKTLKDKLKK